MTNRFDRRALIGATTMIALGAGLGGGLAKAQAPSDVVDSLAIDLAGPPDSLIPAQTRSARDWSILHSIYDSIAYLSIQGDLQPLAAERISLVDELTWEVALRPGLTFHDGSAVDGAAVLRGIEHVQQSDGPAAGNFAVIEQTEIIDDLTVRLVTTVPAPWLLSQLAQWAVLLPESATDESLVTAPVGSGPFRYESSSTGTEIVLVRNTDYTWESPKGTALAERVTYRFVPESTTRIADLVSGSAQLIASVSEDQRSAIEDGGGEVISSPVLGSAFLRVTTDTPPFDDPQLVQAINHAIDVEQIATNLINADSRRIASVFPDERSLGFDPDLAPFAFDQDRARLLLEESGFADGLSVRLQFVGTERTDLLEVIAARLGEVGIDVTLESTELATFNGSWKDADSAPLRFVSWRPIQDPQTLLSLMFASTGPLSRHADPVADDLINRGAEEVDMEQRRAIYQELGRRFQEAPPAVFLWNLTAAYGTRELPDGWVPRPDEWIIPTQERGS